MYDSDSSTVVNALHGSSSVVYTNDTISKIIALTTVDNATVKVETVTPDANGNTTVASGAEVVFIQSSDTSQTSFTPPANAPVLIFQGKGGVDVTINDGAGTTSSVAGVVDRVVIGSAGNDRIVIADGKNTQVVLGTGNSTVVGGAGSDTIVAGLGNSTIVGGGGNDIAVLRGDASDYTVSVGTGGTAVVTSTNANGESISSTIGNIQYVQTANGEALIFAKDSEEAAIATLYQTAFGRTADAGGLDYWFDLAKSGATLDQITSAFVFSAEYQATQAQKSNEEFINGLYLHTFGRQAEADGLAYWKAALDSGGATRAQLLRSFVEIAAAHIDGSEVVEATVVGYVTVVQNIV